MNGGKPRYLPIFAFLGYQQIFVLKLQQYDFTVVYTSGANNPTDCMSRSPSKNPQDNQERLAEEFVNCILKHHSPKKIPIETIIEETRKCADM